ncbi:hypothetical protein N7466_004806 [Penicillium verhagenii]|uniref:uncharacterized protein n=1 Tax=Penicillium verhagenii TaxID=1562060 RepID=UPI002545A889|nr:uncharacterized protein N7466_004806 [Penicillium verhagenii]KAJ5935259.1 hypothetical protein N7466_004806 [Penicillium verhagenii]
MTGLVNKPLSMFRRPDSPRPLHTRWGDVAISVPTDGSWNQYNNPHRPPQEEREAYGPGYISHYPPSNRHDTLHRDNNDEEEDTVGIPAHPLTSVHRRNSLSLGTLRPGRLSVRLASRPKHLRGEAQPERDAHQQEPQRTDFAYKPIQQGYTLDTTEKSKQPVTTAPFKYIPTNGRYLKEIPAAPPPRSQSAMSHRSSRSRRDSFTESLDERFSRRGSHQEDDRNSLRSSIGESSDSSSSKRNYDMMPRRGSSPFVPADRRRASLMKPMTLAMVPDPEDLYE